MNADKIKFRCSSIGELMTGTKKGWSVDDSLTCKRKLVEIYRSLKHCRESIHSNKYTQKGTKMEEDAITLYSRFRKIVFTKNKVRLSNDMITGECDIHIPNKETIDIKCSWSLDTLPHVLTDSMDSNYEYQGFGYMDLFKVKKHTVAYCLVNAPANLILNEKKKLFYELGCPDETDEDFKNKCIEIEKNMIFDMAQFKRDNPGFDFDCTEWKYDIDIKDRIVEFVIHFREEKMNAINKRLSDCKEWMNKNLFKEDIEKESLESIENAKKKYKEKIAAINELKAKLKHVI